MFLPCTLPFFSFVVDVWRIIRTHCFVFLPRVCRDWGDKEADNILVMMTEMVSVQDRTTAIINFAWLIFFWNIYHNVTIWFYLHISNIFRLYMIGFKKKKNEYTTFIYVSKVFKIWTFKAEALRVCITYTYIHICKGVLKIFHKSLLSNEW